MNKDILLNGASPLKLIQGYWPVTKKQTIYKHSATKQIQELSVIP